MNLKHLPALRRHLGSRWLAGRAFYAIKLRSGRIASSFAGTELGRRIARRCLERSSAGGREALFQLPPHRWPSIFLHSFPTRSLRASAQEVG